MIEKKHRATLYKLVASLFVILLLAYSYLFFDSMNGRLLSAQWTTDDALQQVYPFWEALNPGIFEGDLITEVMKGYLAPLHYWLGMGLTLLTRDPIMTAHWMHIIQLMLALSFTFGVVRHFAGSPAACFAVIWLLHTRPIMQRLTGGLPRGWSAAIIAAFLYFFLTRQYRAVFVLLLIGCVLHPPTTFICGFAFSLWLLFKVIRRDTRAEALNSFKLLLILTPLYTLITFTVVHRPNHIGSMVTLSEAQEIPEFQYPGGRFPFVPLQDLRAEVRTFAYQAFIHRFHEGIFSETPSKSFRPHPFMKEYARLIVIAVTLLLLLTSIFIRKVLPTGLWFFLVAVCIVYLTSRELAFLLYVPNRHLQFPMAFFFIVTFSIGIWNLASLSASRWGEKCKVIIPACMLIFLGSFIVLNSGDGLKGDLNFNYSTFKRGGIFDWLRDNTSENAVIAGHPTFIDGVMLFAKRRGFITTETYHPFYPQYLIEARRRIEVSLRAHYAKTLEELWQLLQEEKIDYFVFERARFYPDALENNTYQLPHTELAAELGKRKQEEYAFRQIPRELDEALAPYQVYRDARSVVVDVQQLGIWLSGQVEENDNEKTL